MHRIKMGNNPEIFHKTKKPNRKYPTIFSNLNYGINNYSLKLVKYSVSYRGSTLWNTIINKRDKKIERLCFLKRKLNQSYQMLLMNKCFFLINKFVTKKSYLLGA